MKFRKNILQIPRFKGLSKKEFKIHFLEKKQPVILEGEALHWKAYKKWSFDFFRNMGKDVSVDFKIGNVMQYEPTKTQFSLQDFIHYMERDNQNKEKIYLSVFELFKAFPKLESDIDTSLFRSKNIFWKLGWIDPKGTVTGLHRDFMDNIFIQLRGRKHFYLMAPNQSDLLYQSKKYDPGINCSLVDLENYDPDTYPLFEYAVVFEANINPGDLLFIPKGWWHHVKSLDNSISINIFGSTWWEAIKNVKVYGKYLLHKLRLYRNGNCTCHASYLEQSALTNERQLNYADNL